MYGAEGLPAISDQAWFSITMRKTVWMRALAPTLDGDAEECWQGSADLPQPIPRIVNAQANRRNDVRCMVAPSDEKARYHLAERHAEGPQSSREAGLARALPRRELAAPRHPPFSWASLLSQPRDACLSQGIGAPRLRSKIQCRPAAKC